MFFNLKTHTFTMCCKNVLFAIASFITRLFFPLKGKLKGNIIDFLYEVCNDII